MTVFIKSYFSRVISSLLVAALAVAVLPVAASAQAEAQTIQGTIQSINGTFNITVQDQNGDLDNVELHQGTVINPTGLTLAPGMSVTISGYDDGSAFQANVIETPYQYSGPLPTPVYYGAGWWYPGFAYGYGPSFSLFVGTGAILVSRPWYGRWWAPTPVHAFVGRGWGVGVRVGGVGVAVGGGYRYPQRAYEPAPAPAYRYPESRGVAPRYGAPAPAAPAYRYPESRVAPPTQNFRPYNGGGGYQRPAQSAPYSAPRYNGGGGYAAPRYNSAPARYSAPAAQRSSGGGQRYSNSGGGRAQAGNRR